jgi:predicted DNA-binding transcriptional regulator AlpA
MVFLSMATLRAKGIVYSKPHLNRLVRQGKFPRPIKVGS